MQSTNPIVGLLRSRKFLLAVFALVQSIVLHYASVPQEIWLAVDGLVGVVIAGIAYEDGQEKGAATVVNAGTVDSVDASTTTAPKGLR